MKNIQNFTIEVHENKRKKYEERKKYMRERSVKENRSVRVSGGDPRIARDTWTRRVKAALVGARGQEGSGWMDCRGVPRRRSPSHSPPRRQSPRA